MAKYTGEVTREHESIYHHHVPRFYLRAWATENRIWWSGYGRILCSELTVVGGENHFYRLDQLCGKDRFHLAEIAKRLAYGSEANRRFLDAFTLPHIARSNLLLLDPTFEMKGETVAEHIRKLDLKIANAAEDYHTSIENTFQPYLASMLQGEVAFYDDDQKAAEFLYAFMLQFTRTKGPREIIAAHPGPFDNIRGVWNLLHQMVAFTAGASFFLDRRRFKIVLIDNCTAVPFITGDQPIINLHADLMTRKPPERMEMYYPLSPTKAMLYLERSTSLYTDRQSVTMEEAHRFNQLIAENAYKQLFAASEDSLKIIAPTAA